MPTITIQRLVNAEETASALQERLGSRYEVTTRGSGPQEAIKVKQSTASFATVRTEQVSGVTKFHVHGGGFVISRMINEFGIAKRVASTIEEAFGGNVEGQKP